jgi:hypothetical protein
VISAATDKTNLIHEPCELMQPKLEMAFTPIKCWIFGSKLLKINIVSIPCEAFKLLRSFVDYALVGKQLRGLI